MPGRLPALAGALVLAVAGAASAHSILLDAVPAANAAVTAPLQASLRFNNRIEKPLSRLRLVDERGRRHELAVAPRDGGPDRLTASVPALVPGRYRLEWQVLSADGHVVSGSYAFRVVP
jgi:methionine-rich copper-binding protein CopC